MIELLKKIFLGRKILQPLYALLFKLSIKGMNYDRGHIVSDSGEKHVIDFISKNSTKSPLTIFDVGANTGEYSRLVLDALRNRAEIYAFEPQKLAYQQLSESIKSNNFSAFNIGLGNVPGIVKLYKNNEGSVFGSLYYAKHAHLGVELDKTEEVTIETLDQFCLSNAISHIDLLKIDVEGHEIEVLKGAKEMLKTEKINFIQFEFGIASIESRVFMKDFFQLLYGYDIYRILPNSLYPITYTEYSELFLTTNYLAIKKGLKH
jgi:FkbM family methyltransferase